MPKYEFIAVDFDGTLCTNAFPDVGEPNQPVIDYIKDREAEGSKIILYTNRENGTRRLLDEAVDFCTTHGIRLYAVNENPGNPHAATIGLLPKDSRKVYADLYIDDKAINPADIGRADACPLVELVGPMEPVAEPTDEINVVSVRWFDGYMEEFDATEVRFGSDLLFLRLADGKNRQIPLRQVRWFGMSKESHQKWEATVEVDT